MTNQSLKEPTIHQFTIDKFLSASDSAKSPLPVHFQIIALNNSYFIWIGTTPASDQQSTLETLGSCNQLAVAMACRFGEPSSSTLFRSTLEDPSELFAKRLASRMKDQIFVSVNLDSEYSHLFPEIERAVHDRIRIISGTAESLVER